MTNAELNRRRSSTTLCISDVVEILVVVCSFFSASDLIKCMAISKRWRRACDVYFGPLQRSYFLRAVSQRAVEIALPSCVLAASYDPQTSYLYVACTTSGAVSEEEQEVVLYVRGPEYDLHCSAELEFRCSPSVTSVSFEGPFLRIPARDGELQLFDCKRLLPVRLPHFITNFGSSADGSVVVLSLAGQKLRIIRVADAPEGITASSSLLLSSASSPRAERNKCIDFDQCDAEERQLPEVSGDVFAICVSTKFLCLMHGEPAAWEATVLLFEDTSTSFGSGGEIASVSLPPRSRVLGKGSFVARIEHDESSVLFFETFTQSLTRWNPITQVVEILWRPTVGHRGGERFLSSFSILYPSHVYSLVSKNTVSNEYTLHIRSWDRSVEKRIALRGPSIVTSHPKRCSILVSLVGAVVPRHPLVEAIESGVATLLTFGSHQHGDGDEEDAGTGIRTLTLLTFGLVGFSLAWTLWALFYWGWWMRSE